MERTACIGTQENCLRCRVPAHDDTEQESALVFGPQDRNVETALRLALEHDNIEFFALGPVVIVPNARPRLNKIAACLSSTLPPVTQAGIRAAYAPAGVRTAEEALAAFLFAEPLPLHLANMPHEWVREALLQDWLFSVFHPILDAQSGEVFAHEALIRARNPETQETIGAGAIIAACNQLNLQHQLDQKARHSAIANAASLHLPDTARFFINFLPNTIYDPKICLRTTMEAAEEFGIGLNQLVFEVVETEQIPDMKRLRHILAYYQERGAKTAVDDMGAGFTSMQYLTALHPDYVKMDRDVVVEAAQNRSKRKAFEEIVALAHRLDIAVIAEGIETPEQMQICQAAEVDYVQGFLFARPANPPEAVAPHHFFVQAKAA